MLNTTPLPMKSKGNTTAIHDRNKMNNTTIVTMTASSKNNRISPEMVVSW